MNILLVSFDYPPLTGGIANLSYEVAKNLSAEDKLIVLAPAIKGYKEFDNKSRLITFRIINIKVIREIVLFFMMLYLIFKFRIGIIYDLAWYPEAGVSCFISILTGIPYVIHVHAADYFEDRRGFFNKLKYNRLRTFLKRLVFSNAGKVIAVSNFTKNRLIEGGVDPLKINVIPNGVDNSRFIPNLDAKEIIFKHRLENKKTLLTVARLDGYKGHDMVIKALPGLILKFPDIKYIIVGKGSYERELRRLVEELNLKDEVVFTGWVDDALVPLYYNACDVFIMLSREDYDEGLMEGFGIAFLEASACGKPSIGGRSGGIEDAVIDGVTGLLVNPVNLNEIEETIIKILNDEHYANSLGANGLERIRKEMLNWHSVSMKIREILSDAKDHT